jgi:plasmid stabilization system protein ParE
MIRISIHDAAEAELTEAASFYESRTAGPGRAFLDEFEKSLARISSDPEAFPAIGQDVRRLIVRRFPYSVFFAVESEDFIRVLAVAHQKRRPGYWRNRL